jgi:TRAP-type C4-dicarboxylate transport system substrate-binding protein
MNKATYDRLSANQKKVVDEHCSNEWAERVAAPWADFEAAGRPKIRAAPGHDVYTLSPEQIAEWRKAAEPLHKAWADSVRKNGIDPDAAMKELTDELAKRKAAL